MAEIHQKLSELVEPNPIERSRYLQRGPEEMAEIKATIRRCCNRGAAALAECGLTMNQDRASGAIEISCVRRDCTDVAPLLRAARLLEEHLEQ